EVEKEVKIQISNLHTLVTEKELQTLLEDALQIKLLKVHIKRYGPKSTGNAWIQLDPSEFNKDNVNEITLKAFKALQGFKIREQEIIPSLKAKNKIERHVKKAKQKKVQASNPWDEEVAQLKKKFSDSFKVSTHIIALINN